MSQLDISDAPVQWPILIKHENQPEMTRVDDPAQWQRLMVEHVWLTGEGDLVIDITGQAWQVETLAGGSMELTPVAVSPNKLPHEQIRDYVRHHLSASGVCCIAKFNQDNLAGLFEYVATLDDE